MSKNLILRRMKELEISFRLFDSQGGGGAGELYNHNQCFDLVHLPLLAGLIREHRSYNQSTVLNKYSIIILYSKFIFIVMEKKITFRN